MTEDVRGIVIGEPSDRLIVEARPEDIARLEARAGLAVVVRRARPVVTTTPGLRVSAQPGETLYNASGDPVAFVRQVHTRMSSLVDVTSFSDASQNAMMPGLFPVVEITCQGL